MKTLAILTLLMAAPAIAASPAEEITAITAIGLERVAAMPAEPQQPKRFNVAWTGSKHVAETSPNGLWRDAAQGKLHDAWRAKWGEFDKQTGLTDEESMRVERLKAK